MWSFNGEQRGLTLLYFFYYIITMPPSKPRKYVKGSGKDSGGRFIVIDAKNKTQARKRMNAIIKDSDRGSLFRNKIKNTTKKSKDKFKVYYGSRYAGTKAR